MFGGADSEHCLVELGASMGCCVARRLQVLSEISIHWLRFKGSLYIACGIMHRNINPG